jgi:chromosome transmission fidelity protein 8
MPRAILEKQQHSATDNLLPQILHTPSGLALIEIQGKIHVGTQPLIQSALDLQVVSEEDSRDELVDSSKHRKLGTLEFSDNGKDVNLIIGKHQRLRGKISELKTPLAVLKMDELTHSSPLKNDIKTIPILEVIKYKILFNTRPEPVV